MPFLNDVLSRAVPLFAHIKQDLIKGAWSQALCAFCESVIESNTDQGQEAMTPGFLPFIFNKPSFSEPNAPDSPVKENGDLADSKFSKRDFADQFESAYDVVMSSWIAAKDYKACQAGNAHLGPIRKRDQRKVATLTINFRPEPMPWNASEPCV